MAWEAAVASIQEVDNWVFGPSAALVVAGGGGVIDLHEDGGMTGRENYTIKKSPEANKHEAA